MAKTVEYGWAIWNDRAGLYYDTVTDTRSCAIADHVKRGGLAWNECRRKYGDKAVKVRIEVVGQEAA